MFRIISAPTEAASREAASSYLSPVCDDCVAHEGLCKRHEPSVLPQLAQPGWYRLVGHTHYGKETAERELDSATSRLLKRKERKRAKRLRELALAIGTPAAA